MLYIKNISAKLIHIGSIMLKPDERIEDKVTEEIRKKHNIYSKNLSDIPAVKAMMRMNLLEMVDVVYREKATEPAIRREYVDVEPEKKKEPVKPSNVLRVGDALPEEPEEEEGLAVVGEEVSETEEAPAEEAPVEEPKPKKGGRKSSKSKAE